jgi:hypothetical protein
MVLMAIPVLPELMAQSERQGHRGIQGRKAYREFKAHKVTLEMTVRQAT